MTVLPKKKETVAGKIYTWLCFLCLCSSSQLNVALVVQTEAQVPHGCVFLPFVSVTRETLRVSNLKSLRQFQTNFRHLCASPQLVSPVLWTVRVFNFSLPLE